MTMYSKISLVLLAVMIILAPAGLYAQYAPGAFELKQLSDTYDERGFDQGKAISVDGKLMVSGSNGNVSYSYPISHTTVSGFPFDVSLNYCGSVGCTAFKKFDPGSLYSTYQGWDKFHQNRPAWIIGVNGFAIQAIATTASHHCAVDLQTASKTSFNDADFVWTIDGYDFCNRMGPAAGESDLNYTDIIRLLRSDGSILELVKTTDSMGDDNDNRPDLFTGHYFVNEANAKGYGLVEYDSTYWPSYIHDYAFGYAHIPRKLRYYPGDGLEYVFREWIIPYGIDPYIGRSNSSSLVWGGAKAGPTIFYLESINSNSGIISGFKRSRHFYPNEFITLEGGNIYSPKLDSTLDSTRGRALITDFYGHTINYGDFGLTIQSFGRTTKVQFATQSRSGSAASNSIMPLASNGYPTYQSDQIAKLPESASAINRSYLGYVTAIIDPEGRKTSFAYEQYTRKYKNYGFPKAPVGGGNVTATLKNYRLKRITEPTASYAIHYTNGSNIPSGVPNEHDSTSDETLVYVAGVPGSNDPFLTNNVASYIKKYDKAGTLLTTQHNSYSYDVSKLLFDHTRQEFTDNITDRTKMSEQYYTRYLLPDFFTYLPRPRYTALTSTIEVGADTVHTTIQYDTLATSGNFIFPSETITTVNSVTKSKQQFSYEADTLRLYDNSATTRRFGWDVTKQVTSTVHPANGNALFRDTVEYTYLPAVDTTLWRLDTNILKLQMIQRYLELKAHDSISVPWEYAFYDPRVLRFTVDSAEERGVLPPQFGMVQRQWRSDGSGNFISGVSNYYHNPAGPFHYFNDLQFRGNLVADTIIGRNRTVKFLNGQYSYNRGWGKNLLQFSRNANGALQRYYFDDYSSLKIRDGSGNYKALGHIKTDNDVSHDTLLPHGQYFAYYFEKPLISEQYLRHYNTSGVLKIDTLLQMNEYSFYGRVKSTIDYNGNYSRFAYDKNGRMLTGWLPFDFPRQESPDTIAYTGTEAIDLMGVTHHVMSIDTMNCAVDTSWTGAGPSDTTEVEGLYAAHPVTVPDSCPCAHGHHGPTTKRDRNELLESCVSPRFYPGGEYYLGVLDYTVDSASSLRFISPITDAKLQLHITNIEGECVALSVEVPQFGFTKLYYLNCDEGAPLGGGGARTKRDDDRSLLSDTLSDPTYAFTISLASIKDSLATLLLGQHLKIYLHVSTAGDGVTFVDGSQGEDTRPKLLLTGTYHRISDGADYTVAYQHDDSALTTTITAKVDDSLHTINQFDPTYTLGAKIRRSQATNYFGADYRLNKTLISMIGDATNAARVDTVEHVYTGEGVPLMTKDQMRDSVQTRYDASGRPDTIINADSTMSFVLYKTGTPASFGISDQEFYGFCAATTTINEDGVRHTRYTDAFDHVRRVIADTNGLHLTTRFDYDSLGQLTRVINPKGDSTLYLYDDFGRIAIKVQADIGGVSYAYDHLGNVRFTQNQDQFWKGRMTFTEYDDLNRPTLVGEAILCDRYGDPDYENDGPEDGWLWGHLFDGSGHTIGSRARQGKERDRTVLGEGTGGGDGGGGISIDPCSGINRMTEIIDGSKLHTGDTTRDTLVTTNPTIWNTALSAVPTFWPYSKLAKKTCTLTAIEPLLNETSAPVTPLLMHPVQNYASPAGPRATIDDFEDVAKYPHFPRIAVAYDTLPPAQGAIWSTLPAKSRWDSLAPTGHLRNLKGKEVATAYREHGGEPYHFNVLSYDERGRVEALLRYTENLGFDAVYYSYNSMNKVTAIRSCDAIRQYVTYYGYDNNGRVDTMWAKLTPPSSNLGLAAGGNLNTLRYPTLPPHPFAADITYHYTKIGQVDTMRFLPVTAWVNYAYNHRKWLDSLMAMKGTDTLFREVLSYDPTGQITQQTWQHNGGTEQTQTYAYDSVQRLTSYTQGSMTEQYYYDKVGNRDSTVFNDGVNPILRNAYTYGGLVGGANRLAQTKKQNPLHQLVYPGQVTYAYDSNGAVIRKSRAEVEDPFSPGGRQEFAYSYRGLLRRAADGGWDSMSLEARYRYSPGGEREQKRITAGNQSDTVRKYPWVYYLLGGDGAQLAVYHGQQTTSTVCSDTGRRVYMYPFEYLSMGLGYNGRKEKLASLITKPDGTKEFRIGDHLASLRVSFGLTGLANHFDYDPWGNLATITGASTPRLTFNEQEKDAETQLFDLGERKMDAETGRFTRTDVLQAKFPSTSPYSYANNNPLRLTDPTGRQTDNSGTDYGQKLQEEEEWDLEQAEMDQIIGAEEAAAAEHVGKVVGESASGVTMALAGGASGIGGMGVIDAVDEENGPLLLEGQSAGAYYQKRGTEFENQVGQSLHLEKNTEMVAGLTRKGYVNTVPDYYPTAKAILEVKTDKYLSNSLQLQAQASYASGNGKSFNLAISPSVLRISIPLQQSIAATNGNIFQFDPTSGCWSPVTFDPIRPSVVNR